jgi:hypothetical protein
MSAPDRRGPTRRSFVRGAALGAAGLAANTAPAPADTPPDPKAPKLSKVGQAQLDALFAGQGARFNDAEKKDLARLLAAAEQTGAKLHAFGLEDNSEPAVIFRVYKGGK